MRKVAGSTDLMFVYNEGGQLLGEYTSSGVVREYVWMDQLPVGVLVNGVPYAIEADHLGTPRRAFDPATHGTVWEWTFEGNPFGDRAPRAGETSDGGVAIELPLRYPGQYDDAESDAHYNYYRDYEPSTGRYVESDPIGLGGGNATYGYVKQRPFMLIDRLGLISQQACCAAAVQDNLDRNARDPTQRDRVFLACCDGSMFSCYNVNAERVDNSIAYEVIVDCGTRHEDSHHRASVCPPCGVERADWRRGDPFSAAANECLAYFRQHRCLTQRLRRCKGEPVCESQIGAEIDRARDSGFAKCGGVYL